jgi:hypothetical protein
MNEFNFFKSKVFTDKSLFFFGEEETLISIEDTWLMAHILFSCSIFPSVTQARKNGWDKPIPKGFSQIRAGKNKVLISVFNENESLT